MLERMNTFIHGYVLIPILLSFRKRGLGNILNKSFNVNYGFLSAALKMLHSLGYVTLDSKQNYIVVNNKDNDQFMQQIPEDLLTLYKNPLDYFSLKNITFIQPLINKILINVKSIKILHNQQFILGPILVPFFIFLRTQNENNVSSYNISNLLDTKDNNTLKMISELLLSAGLISNDDEKLLLNIYGKFMLDRAYNMATACSYRPLLYKIDEVIFGNYLDVFKKDDKGHELHVDRKLNVIASGFQHGKYFKDFMQVIKDIFNTLPLSEQPKYLVDMGCGDGSLLKLAYSTIKDQTIRGNSFDQYPLSLIGADFNLKSLEVTRENLCSTNVDLKTVQASITDPKGLIDALLSIGIDDTENCLHIRSFLDHECMYIDESSHDNQHFANIISSNVSVSKNGGIISPQLICQMLSDNFARWSSIVSKHGILILEVHTLDANTVAKSFTMHESLHFDFLQSCSFQHLVEADLFCMCAAKAGLLPKLKYSKKYPEFYPYTRIQMNYFIKKDYFVTYFSEKDVCEILEIAEKLDLFQKFNREYISNILPSKPLSTIVIRDNLTQKMLGFINGELLDIDSNISEVNILITAFLPEVISTVPFIVEDLTEFYLHIHKLKNMKLVINGYHNFIT